MKTSIEIGEKTYDGYAVESGRKGRRTAECCRPGTGRIVAVRHGRRLSNDRLERRRHRVACLRQRRGREGGRLNGDEQLQPRGALRILTPGNRRLVVMCGVTASGMPAEVRVHHAGSAVMAVVVVVVQVRVKQGRTQRRQLQGGG
jgi:hypothetical protein